jgi:hypothetical protein
MWPLLKTSPPDLVEYRGKEASTVAHSGYRGDVDCAWDTAGLRTDSSFPSIGASTVMMANGPVLDKLLPFNPTDESWSPWSVSYPEKTLPQSCRFGFEY